MYIPSLTAIQHYTSLTLFWFRRDLRLADNHGLYQALAFHERVLPIFIFDTNILSKLEDAADRRVNFIYEQVQTIDSALQAYQSSLCVCYGSPVAIYKELAEKLKIQACTLITIMNLMPENGIKPSRIYWQPIRYLSILLKTRSSLKKMKS